MDVEKGQNKKSSKKKKMPATNGMDARNQRQQKNLPNNESHPTQPKVQFPTHTTEKKPTHNTPEMPQQNQMDSKQGKSKKSAQKEKQKENGSKMDVKKNQQKDNISVMPQQDQMDSDTNKSAKVLKNQKSTENGMDLKGSHQEKSNVQLTLEQQQITQEREALARNEQILMQQQQELVEHIKQVEQLQKESIQLYEQGQQMLVKVLLYYVKQLEKDNQQLRENFIYQCCFKKIRITTATILIAFLHAFIITAIFASILAVKLTTSELENIKRIETAGWVILGCSYIPIIILFAAVCFKKIFWLLSYIWLGAVEITGILMY